ncbi:MAG: aconitate hydratase AcnA [Chloroflexi bacterium]|nr:MAG: aconitate hydratase AcnA [Chloroflexota bacterium]TME50972.1 MAG: aconitate hydratase AcnA [Chloroflexota bacterium]
MIQRARLAGTDLEFYPLKGLGDGLPMTVKVLLEGLIRLAGAGTTAEENIGTLAKWPAPSPGSELPFLPARVLMQDFTGVPAVVDLAAMRSAMRRAGKDAGKVDPLVPVDLIIDHSVQVDSFGFRDSYTRNIEKEIERNRERYSLLRWAQQAFHNFSLVPPGMGICHQVNLEYIARVVQVRDRVAIPDTLMGTDSHTTMVNGLGVLGWGVGGIEAEAAMLGQPAYLASPVVVGVRFHGALPAGSTATDLVLTLTEMLRKHGVVEKFVEFCGDGLSSLSVPDRATMSNMCPEYGATSALFPVDAQTLRYLEITGRSREQIDLVDRYTKEQGLFRRDGDPIPRFTELLELDLTKIEPSLAGPKRPQDRAPLPKVWESFNAAFAHDPKPSPEAISRLTGEGGPVDGRAAVAVAAEPTAKLENGCVVIAAITSCTNTSNPSVMVAAGLLAKNAVERGLSVHPYVKTSLAPGSRVVTDYLNTAGLMEPLEKLGFYLVGYGCTTCIGNSGPLASPEVEAAVMKEDLSVVAVLSGNRNFESRIHPLVKASYLGSPPLVVAYALAGTVHLDLTKDPIGHTKDGKPVMLSELWPSQEEVNAVVQQCVQQEMFKREYSRIFEGDEHWKKMSSPTGPIFQWEESSTYVKEPPYFEDFGPEPPVLGDVDGARVLAVLGDSVTTDHISPAGAIPVDSPAGKYLVEHGVERSDFNSYGARRGNHEVMARGTFGNIRLRNKLVEREGYWTRHFPDGTESTIFEASERYRSEGVPLIVIAGKEYGSGSSRDWAAKGPLLLGVRAVIGESFERIHRSNLVGMGILPLQFAPGESAQTLGLSGHERYTIRGLEGIKPGQDFEIAAASDDGRVKRFTTRARVDNEIEVGYLRHGGILPLVLRELIAKD